MQNQYIEILEELKSKGSKIPKAELRKKMEAYADMDYDYLSKIGGTINIGIVGESMMTISFLPHGMKEELYSCRSQKTFMFNLMKLRARIDNNPVFAEAADLLYPYPLSVACRNKYDDIFRTSKIVIIGTYCHEVRACAQTTQLPHRDSRVCPHISLATGNTLCEALLNLGDAKPQPVSFDPMYLMGNPC